MTEIVFRFKNLGCANCGAKIAEAVSGLREVESASLDFVGAKLVVKIRSDSSPDGSDSNLNELEKNVKRIVEKIEPGTEVELQRENAASAKKTVLEQGTNERSQIVRLAIGLLFFAIGVALKFSDTVELILFLCGYIAAGGGVLYKAAKGIFQGQVFNENFLMTIATAGAFLVGEYPEGAGVMLFYLAGEILQDRAVNDSRKSIAELMDIRPDYANLYIDGGMQKVSPAEVRIGDRIIVQPGEKVPLDGRVISGRSMADTSALTGESMPRLLEPGAEALSGFININGVLTIEVSKDYGQSTVSKILELVQNAAVNKAPTENFITKFARYYTPAVVVGALLLAVIPPLLIPGAIFADWLYRALIFLVISCPCALVISIPLGFFGGIGAASRKGILIKGSNYLEALNHVETVVFDKTGTLTKGAFRVSEICVGPSFNEDSLLEYAARAESHSNHPIALSIREFYKEKTGRPPTADNSREYCEVPGRGVSAEIEGKKILVGNILMMLERGVLKDNISQADEEKTEKSGARLHVAIDGAYAGNILISDEIKEDAIETIKNLKEMGIKKTVMLTGDVRSAGEKTGALLGLDEVYSELLPLDKVDSIERLEKEKSKNGIVLFVGDGINDAPPLARADVGAAMGALGSDAAIEAADIVIMNDRLSQITDAIRIAKRTKHIVLQNIVFALGVKLLFLLLGAFGEATMWEAVFADVGVTLIAVINATRVMNIKKL